MKKFLVFFLLVSFTFAPLSTHAQSMQLSGAERQAMLLQIQQLQAILLQLLKLQAEMGGNPSQSSSNSFTFTDDSYGITFDYQYPTRLAIDFWDESNTTADTYGADAVEWMMADGTSYLGSVALGNKIVADAFKVSIGIVSFAAALGSDSENKKFIFESIGTEHGYTITEIGENESGKPAGTIIAIKEFMVDGEGYAIIVRTIYGGSIDDSELADKPQFSKYTDIEFSSRASALRFLRSIIRTLEVDQALVAEQIEASEDLLSEVIQNRSRNKALDAATKASLNNSRSEAELYYDENDFDYRGVCSEDEIKDVLDDSDGACQSTRDAYVIYAELSEDYYCIDATGFAGAIDTKPSTRDYQCE